MPIRQIRGTDHSYYLIIFDENGKERPEADGAYLSGTLTKAIADAAPSVTDVFVTSHGWKGDVPAAIEQYDRWVGIMATQAVDLVPQSGVRRHSRHSSYASTGPAFLGVTKRSRPPVARGRRRVTRPLFRRKRPWLRLLRELPTRRTRVPQSGRYLTVRLAILDRRPCRRQCAMPMRSCLPSGARSGDPGGRPGDDQDGFDPATIIAEASAHGEHAAFGPASATLGVWGGLRDAALSPLRQLSFWR